MPHSLQNSCPSMIQRTDLPAATHFPRPQRRASSNSAHSATASVGTGCLSGGTWGSDERRLPQRTAHRSSSSRALGHRAASGASSVQMENDAPSAAENGHGVSEGLYYDWRYHSRVHYMQSGSEGPAVLLIHGFGVGGWQFKV